MSSATLTGNWRAMTAWTKKLDYISSNRFSSGFAHKLADTLLDLVDQGFKNATDPDDHAWKAKAVPDGKPPLHGASGELSQKRNWLKKQVDPRRIRIGPKPSIAAKARFAQFGTGKYGPKDRAFLIKPKNGKALSFMTARGRVAYASVMNPGAPQRRMVPGEGRLPHRWLRALTAAKNAYLNENMRKAA